MAENIYERDTIATHHKAVYLAVEMPSFYRYAKLNYPGPLQGFFLTRMKPGGTLKEGIRIRNERDVGHALAAMEKNKDSQGKIQVHTGGTNSVPPDEVPTLKDLGISRDKSSRWQHI